MKIQLFVFKNNYAWKVLVFCDINFVATYTKNNE